MIDIAHFIGLNPIDWRRDHANRSGVPNSKLFQKVLMRDSQAKTIFVNAFPESFITSLKRKLMERNTGSKPELTDEDRTYFRSCIADEASKIEQGTQDSDLLRSLYRA